jgi:protein gp37
MMKSKIEWTNETWNPITGCTKVSQGCKNCYAERVAERFWGDRKFTDIQLHEDRLEQPLRWKKPRMVFVNSMSDLFHEDVPFEFIRQVFDVMGKAENHIFQILTKRPNRMKEFYDWDRDFFNALPPDKFEKIKDESLPNVWLGVSVEDQKTADERIPILLDCPSAIRWVSVEPMLSSIDLSKWLGEPTSLDWVIVGGESGPNARPMNSYWARLVRDQCQSVGVPFFFKQGSQNNWGNYKDFDKFPKDLQIREYPNENQS